MTYQEAIDYLYTRMPMFQREGATAYKPGLDTSLAIDAAFGNSHRCYRTIHVGGTNGKGSTSHSLAAVLQQSGYKVGLYTSPHLIDFRERIRVNGQVIPEADVIDFVERYQAMHLDVTPSFFELTMVMAFEYFAKAEVDVAVIEVGLGGRLDSTNIITPELCVITNISFDHMQFLGNTLTSIASEKAGIIKHNIPVVIGESAGDVRKVFSDKAEEVGAPIRYADDETPYGDFYEVPDGLKYEDTPFGDIISDLTGECQPHNMATILTSIDWLRRMGWNIPDTAIRSGLKNVCSLTGLMGRWMKFGESPLRVCDTGHNTGGWQYIARQLERVPGVKHMVIGFVNDKDVTHILEMMPRDARYYFTRASVSRALPAESLQQQAKKVGLQGEAYNSVGDAYRAACADATPADTVFVGGSTFVVADLLSELQ